MFKLWIAPAWVLALVGLAADPASAHMPYAVEVKTLQDIHGEPLILERLFGDGIFAPDPVSLQVRNRNGAVIAYTSVNQSVSVYCSSLEFCWACPHSTLSLWATPVRLNHESLDYDQQISTEARSRLKREGGVTRGFENPDSRSAPLGFAADSSLLALSLSPLLIIKEHAIFLFAVFLVCLFRFIHDPRCSQPTAGRQGVARVLLAILWSLARIVHGVLVFMLFCGFYFTPQLWAYTLAAMALGEWGRRRCLQRA